MEQLHMNKKELKLNKLVPLLFTGLVLTSLASCQFEFQFNFGNHTTSFDVSYSEDNYYIPNSLKYNLRQVNSQLGWVTSKTTGNQKMMVIPVELSGGTQWNSTMISNLQKAFFGETSETKYESVSSYFKKSSYGNLNITGEVLDVFSSTYTVKYLDTLGTEAPGYVIDEFYKSIDSTTLKKYDLDGDGFVDNAVFIYSNNYSRDEDSAYWAWCYSHSLTKNTSKPSINNYMWASYYFMEDKYIDGYRSTYVDTHTYIHETGHMLGLDDYYSYDATDVWEPAGKLEMQSYNVGDHNIYSKLAMGWVKPYVPTGSTQIKLRTSAEYPDAILINNNWNGSAFDEYILIEYYTPRGLNEQDKNHNFGGAGKMYDYNGLRIYHIDARLAKLKAVNGEAQFVSYSDTIPTSFDGYYYYVGASNSYCYSYLQPTYAKKYRYVHLLDQGELNKVNDGKGGKVVSSYALWTGSKTFTPSQSFFANGYNTFNDGSTIGYALNVSELTDESCVVNIAVI